MSRIQDLIAELRSNYTPGRPNSAEPVTRAELADALELIVELLP